MKTSAIVTVYNRPDMLLACLRALALNTVAVDQVVVSDDGSNAASVDRMLSLFSGFPFPITYVWQDDQGYRLAAARNNALCHATGDYILSLDCDILLLPDVVEQHLRLARPGQFLAANRAWVGEADTRELLSVPFGPQRLLDLWDRADRSHVARTHRQFTRNAWLRRLGLAARHKPKILGCHFSLFKRDIEAVNGFDERYVGWGLEDDDFSLRLHRAGVRGRSLILDAHALHLWHPSVDSCPPRLQDSPNMAYFSRRDVTTRCERGLAVPRPPLRVQSFR